MKIVADCDIPFMKGVLEPYADVIYLPGDKITAATVADADALLIRTRTRCDSALLSGSKVKFIGTATIGFDHIDMGYCSWNKIKVVSAKGSNSRGVLQWVAATLAWLAANRGKQPENTTIGIIGVGNIGSIVKEYAKSWGYKVMCSDPPREQSEKLSTRHSFYSLKKIISQSDIITIHAPLTVVGANPTFHMVNREFLASMKQDSVLVNSARGGIIGPFRLYEILSSGYRNIGAVIDTWNNEPNIDVEILEKVLLGTPHIAGYSLQGKAAATAIIVNALSEKFALPLKNWYPEGVKRSQAVPISWKELNATINQYIDMEQESARLKAAPEDFEKIRSNYTYRNEYF